MEKQILRHRSVCRSCTSKLPPRTEVWMDPASRHVWCLTCARMGYVDVTPPAPAPLEPEAPAPAPVEMPEESPTAAPGGVVSNEAQPTTGPAPVGDEEWSLPPPVAWDPPAGQPAPVHPGETAVTEPPGAASPEPAVAPARLPEPMSWTERRRSGLTLPKLGIEPVSLTDRAAYQSTQGADPLAGASPELVAIAQTLAAARSRGVEVLSRRWVAERSTSIDHLVVAPNGLWVIHAEPTPAGRVERRDTGDWFDSEPRLFVGDVDRTETVAKMAGLVETMQAWLSQGPYGGVPVVGVICFTDAPGGWFSQPFQVGGVSVMLRHQLVEPMLTSILLAPAAQDDLVRHLAVSFRSAS